MQARRLHHKRVSSVSSYGATDYIYSKGPSDGWCLAPHKPPLSIRGSFWVNEGIRIANVIDGTSNTFCMGEGAGGSPWPLCRGAGCGTAYEGPIGPQLATGLWPIMRVGSEGFSSNGVLTAGLWGSTRDSMNKWPVTDSWIDVGNSTDCRSSDNGGTHSTANFRSDHTGGAQFLFIDGSVRFVSEAVDMAVYRATSTIAGGEVATVL